MATSSSVCYLSYLLLAVKAQRARYALLGVLGLDRQWLGDVWHEYNACNIKGTAWSHAINIYVQ